MKKRKTRAGISRSAVWIMLLMISAASGQYELSWYTIDGGGGQSSGGAYTLTGTIGQADPAWSNCGSYELLGGFWPGGAICIVDFESYARFAELWRDSGFDIAADLDGSGLVDFGDLKKFADLWLHCCPTGWPLK